MVALTANAAQRDIELGMAAGFDAYLTKPLQIPELIATLQRLVEGLVPQGSTVTSGVATEPAASDHRSQLVSERGPGKLMLR